MQFRVPEANTTRKLILIHRHDHYNDLESFASFQMSFRRHPSSSVHTMSSPDHPPSKLNLNEREPSAGSASSLPTVHNPPSFSSLSSYNSKSISKHYALNYQLLSAFDSFNDQHLYRGAYSFGVRFVEVALLEIPKHGYYRAPKHELERLENAKQALRVTEQLELILQDHLVDQARPKDWERIAEFKALALKHSRVPLENDEEEQDSNFMSWEFLNRVPSSSSSVAASADSLCGDILEFTNMFCPVQKDTSYGHATTTPATTTTARRSTSATATYMQGQEQHRDDDEDELKYDDDYELVPPPPTFERWSSSDSMHHPPSRDDLQRALMLSGIVPAAAAAETSVINGSHASSTHQQQHSRQSSQSFNHHRRVRSVDAIDIDILQQCYHEDFEDLRNRGLVRISQINTYQGRLPGSINGCTVIAPLLCVHQFTADVPSEKSSPPSPFRQFELPDEDITHVIDEVTPVILPEVRSKLGLAKHALIIPQDVHDFLIEKQLLTSDQFVTVVGGNVLDNAHVDELVSHLISKDHVKLAATFFFHEHVVAIFRIQQTRTGEVWFDVIDSLPNSETLRRLNMDADPDFIPYACRIRCMSVQALEATIRWFACSRFTLDNKQYIDMYDWDDAYSDFDPRVFQAYLWAEAAS